ncbi:MAG TPA: hypothetical protein VGC53_04150 [Vicinamibacteria bacterium]|jgi:hypothetical protein
MTNRGRLSEHRVALFLVLLTFQSSWLAALPSQGENYAAIRATKRVEAVRIEESIIIDGRLDEDVW